MPGTFLITNTHLFTLSLIYNSRITKFCGMCFLLDEEHGAWFADRTWQWPAPSRDGIPEAWEGRQDALNGRHILTLSGDLNFLSSDFSDPVQQKWNLSTISAVFFCFYCKAENLEEKIGQSNWIVMGLKMFG